MVSDALTKSCLLYKVHKIVELNITFSNSMVSFFLGGGGITVTIQKPDTKNAETT
jgi:hypothetical protein